MTVNLVSNQEKLISLAGIKDFSEDLTVNLNGTGSKVTVAGVLYAKKEDVVNFNINIYHNAPNTTSNIFVRSVLSDRSDVHLEGMVRIKRGAYGTDTYLKEDALLLSSEAKAFVLPSLEIDDNRVKAGHSSSIGPIDTEQLFYLMSRGLKLIEAQKMVVNGYIQPVLDKVPLDLRLKMEKIIYAERS